MSKVIIQECKDYNLEAVTNKINDGIERIGRWDKFIKPGDTVLLKVNLIGPKASNTASVTHSEFVRAVTRILKAHGCNVWIGDSSGGAIAGIAPTAQAMKVAGYEKVAEEEGAVIKNFDREGVTGIIPESGCEDVMYLARPLFDADVVINLPKLKTHSAAYYTGAVKNVFGCIPGLAKAKYHKIGAEPEVFGNIISDIHRGARFSLHIMDGILAMQGEGPTAGTPYEANKILISTDPLALDTAAIKMFGMEIGEVPILKVAVERKLGEGRLENIVLEGDYTSVPTLEGFKLPKRFRSSKERNNKVIGKVIDFLKARPKVNIKKCKSCNICVESCPVKAINRETKAIDYEKCIECMCCHELCLVQAVELKNVNTAAGILMKLYKG
ncbi:MAG: DUF362 domain-containing protein [Bacillota bacterium]|nr:DUF362 domain-containing protein [Bacillota bacterium]